MDTKLRVFVMTMRQALAMLLAGCEDYLDIPYNQSALANRQSKVKQHG